MEKAAAFFGIAPRLIRGVSDSAGVLTSADLRVIRRRIADFERRFPQTGFTAAFMAVSKDFPGATYAYWVFNRCNPAGELGIGLGAGLRLIRAPHSLGSSGSPPSFELDPRRSHPATRRG